MTTDKRITKHYTEEFKKDAVALVKEHGYSVMDAARQLDVHHTSLRAWIKQLTDSDSGEPFNLSEREELKRLRKENRELKMEKETLNKVSVGSIGQSNTLHYHLFWRFKFQCFSWSII